MSVLVQNLTKVYGEQKAVDGVSFTARKGEVLGFLGPNGAGKTTTMKVLTTFIPPTGGKAAVCDFDVEENPMEVRRRIGYLPEHNPLYKELYVQEYLLFIAGLHGIRNKSQRVADMIELTGLTREQKKPIGALSKGYRQRVGLAQAMMHDPEVLILDEPTSGLDPNQLAEIRAVIKQLGAEKTIIFSTHIMQEVQALCDRVLIINKGRIVADDPIDQLRRRIRGEAVLTVEFAKAIDRAALEKIPGVDAVTAMGERRFQLIAAAQRDVREAVFHFAVEQQTPLLEMQQEAFSVEDVFQRLTRS
ncbi:MAG: gliding motility-associated ABC transporter ATP-binding subunit GldA [Saprospiraceae bacterium]|nr:gliding motility-associated ABC transporter ATP-binding subunit GldA [Saprospiraceae bacterium]MCB0676862.1 gliding motility-associated ABC transporter ATP-binding subunit GldA [Saprospiraceae bacterium]